MKSIEELATLVWNQGNPPVRGTPEKVIDFATRFLAAYTDQQEPVAWVPQFSWQRSIDAIACKSKRSFDDIALFTAPPLPAIPAELVAEARQALDSMDDYARMANIDPFGPRKLLEDFINIAAGEKS